MCYVNVYTGYKYTVLSGVCYVNVYTGHQYTVLSGMCVLCECLYWSSIYSVEWYVCVM